MSGRRRSIHGAVARIVVPYLALGAAWILFSDRLLISLIDDPEKLLLVSTAKGWLYVLVTGILLFFLVYGELRRRAKLEELLRRDLIEKDGLVSELNHRVMNNLQILMSIFNLEAESLSVPESRETNGRARARLASMALVQERLYESKDEFGRIELGHYLRSLWPALQEVFETSGAEATFDLEDARAGASEAVPFGLFAAEALSNAMRFGRSPDGAARVEIRLARAAGGSLELSVRDRGPGLRDGASGLGFKLMNALAAQLRGTVERRVEGGTIVVLRFPLPEDSDG